MLVGLSTGDDAGVYLLDEKTALVQTLDFISPVVDDPFTFGKIAAANSLSDVYAMGGRPLTAMNILCFPACDVEKEDIPAILAGALEKVLEAGAALVGGHTVESRELFFGLSVTGTANPGKLFTNRGARPGDLLVLTKPLGAGMLATAVKGGLAKPEHAEKMALSMARLNRLPAESMARHGATAATDVTGFGLAGHALGICRESFVDILVNWEKVPLLEGAKEAYLSGLVPAGAYANLSTYARKVVNERCDSAETNLLACDPQTSGGLLIAIPEEGAKRLLDEIGREFPGSAVIGEILEGEGLLRIE